MSKFLLIIVLLTYFAVPVSAEPITAPAVPESGAQFMPEEKESFGEGLWEMIQDALMQIQPELQEAATICFRVIAAAILVGILHQFPGGSDKIADLAASVAISVLLLKDSHSLIHLGTQTIMNLSEYGKLLLPVMTSAVAAQGGLTVSAALYTGTALFDTVLCNLISKLLIPMIYLFLAVCVANSAVGEELLKQISKFIKWSSVWCLKIILYVFTGYISITGVISGTADVATVKAAKLTISGMVPVVGGILADASETFLVSAGLIKNAAGLYGIFAILAVFIGPFLQIGCHYLLLRATGAVCSVFSSKRVAELIGDFSSAMGLLLAMTGSVCMLLLISTVCFLKGVG